MPDTHERLRCPQCQQTMQTGFLPVSQGMHFIRGDGKAASHFAEDIPGTHAIMRTNKLPAYRCKSCELILFQYGRDTARRIERLLASDEPAQPVDIETDRDEDDTQPTRRRPS